MNTNHLINEEVENTPTPNVINHILVENNTSPDILLLSSRLLGEITLPVSEENDFVLILHLL